MLNSTLLPVCSGLKASRCYVQPLRTGRDQYCIYHDDNLMLEAIALFFVVTSPIEKYCVLGLHEVKYNFPLPKEG